MVRPRGPANTIIPERTLLAAYRAGKFPMAETRDDDDVFWVDPPLRGILPLDAFYISKRLARTVRSHAFRITVDAAFPQVMLGCAAAAPKRMNTWISPLIERSYANLHAKGYAHSVEVWNSAALVGGLYGVSIGAAFFGESMFSRETDASKIALVHLAERLKAGGYMLLDTQFVTEHLTQFGAIEIPRARYKELLAEAVDAKADFYVLGGAGAAG
ncbi:MAG: leucyl/phenylalanyl-tRNA--protein transferase [Alphaproteobacteria bacterium]|nr:leucyl/phenylalanyl-tRNA--protein transferase [Alphaproteobacteria bacterium]